MEDIATPSLVAKAVMDYTDHIMLVGAGAKRFAATDCVLPSLEVAGTVAPDAVAQRQVLRARRGADRIGLDEAEPLELGEREVCGVRLGLGEHPQRRVLDVEDRAQIAADVRTIFDADALLRGRGARSAARASAGSPGPAPPASRA